MTPFYEDYAVTLYCADAREIYTDLGVYQHAIFDPPYDKQTHAGARSSAEGYKINFAPIESPETVVKLATPTRWSLSFCPLELLGEYRAAAGADRWARSGIWDRVDTGSPQFTGDRPAQGAEGIAIWHSDGERKRWNGGGKRGVWRHAIVPPGAERVHETQKPVSLMRALVLDFTDPDDLIVDFFAGSGTTGVAAKICGRRAILVELGADRCAVAAKRIAETSLDERISRVRAVRAKQGALDWTAEA
jgi:hypothetical protein